MKDNNRSANIKTEEAEVRVESVETGAESPAIYALVDARRASGLTQKELAERTGIAQADISKVENGNANPSLRTLRRLAAGMGMELKLEFVPQDE